MKCQAPDVPQPWTASHTEAGPDLKLFRVLRSDMINPRNGRLFERLVLDTPDWVNIIAITPEERIVTIRQFRFGTGRVTLEIPGGVVDPGEAPEAAARRELAEETGYTSVEWISLGTSEPNPAFHNNLCYHWLARNAKPTREPTLDSGEDIAIGTMSVEEVTSAIRKGEIRHTLVVSALARILDLRFPGTDLSI